MRGKQGFYSSPKLFFGITPADAGKTLSDVDRDGNKKDHPRGCGENFFGAFEFGQVPGSPPRMRGKLPYATKTDLKDGITPADAGKTEFHCAAGKGSEDHPRGCGENAEE